MAFWLLVAKLEANVRAAVPVAKIEGFLLESMVPARLELTCGLHRDPVFGPMVLFGIGGTMIEILAETVMLRVPFDRETACAAASSLLGGRIVSGSRGLTAEEIDRFGQVAESVGRLATQHPYIESIDINPLRISAGQVIAADALIVLQPD